MRAGGLTLGRPERAAPEVACGSGGRGAEAGFPGAGPATDQTPRLVSSPRVAGLAKALGLSWPRWARGEAAGTVWGLGSSSPSCPLTGNEQAASSLSPSPCAPACPRLSGAALTRLLAAPTLGRQELGRMD